MTAPLPNVDLHFGVEVTWSGTGRAGAGKLYTDDLVVELSAPESMGGRGVGTNPEELLVCAVSSCFTATLFAALRRAQLPVDFLAVGAIGAVTGFPGRARFARIVVSPTVVGGDFARQGEYEAAAAVAHERCFIGHSLAPEVAYEVGAVRVQDSAPATASVPAAPAPRKA
jgi:peroxiredoxin-like protein